MTQNFQKVLNRYIEELLVNKYIRNCYLIDPITNKEWDPVNAPLSEGLGIKDIHSKSEDISIKQLNNKEMKYKEF